MAPKKQAKSALKKISPKPLPAMEGCCQGKSYAECCKGDGPPCDGNCGCKTSGACCGGIFNCHLASLFTDSKAWVSVLVAFVVMWVFDVVWHGQLLMTRYLETAHLWRPEAEMMALWPWCFVFHGVLALVFTASYLLMNAKNYIQGAKNGALILAPLALSAMGAWLHGNVPSDITQMWAIGNLLQGLLAGLALTAVGHWYCARNGQCSI
ncbi:MAG: hypothetical protein WAZ18_06350 [Alphaproteobacteria bacterium]